MMTCSDGIDRLQQKLIGRAEFGGHKHVHRPVQPTRSRRYEDVAFLRIMLDDHAGRRAGNADNPIVFQQDAADLTGGYLRGDLGPVAAEHELRG